MKINNSLVPLALIALLIVNSCAAAAKASEDRSVSAKQFKKHPEKGVVYLHHPGRAVGAAVSTQIKIFDILSASKKSGYLSYLQH